MRFGVCTSIDYAPLLAAMGFDYVEVHAGSIGDMSEEAFCVFCRQNSAAPIHAEAANCLFPGDLPLTGPQLDLDRVEAYVRHVFSRLSRAGIGVVSFGSGGSRRVPEGFPRDEAWQQLIRVSNLLAALGEEYGVTVALEPLRPEETNIINTQAEGLDLVQTVNRPRFLMLCDVYHMVQSCDGADQAGLAGSLLTHIHIAKPDDRRTLYPGDGTDYAPFFRAWKQIGYDGRISFEGSFSDPKKELPATLEVLRQFR